MVETLALRFPSLGYFLPDLWLVFAAVSCLLLASTPAFSRRAALVYGLGSLIVYGGLCVGLFELPSAPYLFSGAIAGDGFALFFKLFFALASSITMLLAWRAGEMRDYRFGEIAAFLLALTLGMSMMAASTDLLMIYLSLEMVSILSYVLVGWKRHSRPSSEAALKYLLYGAMASGVMIFGMSYLYGMTGSTDIRDIAHFFKNLHGIGYAPVAFFAVLCMMTGFGFKIATFPTQMWCPDVYEGAATPITAFLSVGPKAAGFAMAARFFVTVFHLGEGEAVELFTFMKGAMVLSILAGITMTVGNLAALSQRNLKRLMAYSSIGHAGFLLMGIATTSIAGLEALLFYLIVYLVMNFGAFLVILAVADHVGSEDLEGYRGLGWRSPLLAGSFSVFLFSLTGLPPFAGFVGKYLVLVAVIEKGMYALAVVAVLNSVISLYFYARVIKAMYFETPVVSAKVTPSAFYRWGAVVLVIPTIFFGIYWGPISALATRTISSLF